MVLLKHAQYTMPSWLADNMFFPIVSNSKLGVRIFFVLSGYLITKLLLIEKEKYGSINIKNFYVRRVLRIFPIFYLYLLTILMIKWFFNSDIINNYHDFFIAGAYLWNYSHLFNPVPGTNGAEFLGHYWSLSMEEQFYLIWPFLFLKFNKDALLKILIGILLIMPFLRVGTYLLFPGSRGAIAMMLHTAGDTILIGCLGALIESTANFKAKYLKYLQNKFLIIFSILFIFIFSKYLSLHFKGMYVLSVGISLENIFILIFIFWCIYVPTKFSQLLNTKVFIQLGLISYSMYIWHLLVLRDINGNWFNRFPQNLICIVIVGFISYYLIEKPILKLKNRFKKV